MEDTYITRAIVLNRVSHRESDGRVTLFSFDRGKFSLVARGMKKRESKLAGHLEPLNLIEVMVVRGKGVDYIGNAKAINVFKNIKGDLGRIFWVGQAVKDFDLAIKQGETTENNELFDLLKDYLISEDAISQNSEAIYYLFLYKLLSILGYQPELNRCVVCGGKDFGEKIKFSYVKSGLVCRNCLEPEALQISLDAINLLNRRTDILVPADLKFIKKYFTYIF